MAENDASTEEMQEAAKFANDVIRESQRRAIEVSELCFMKKLDNGGAEDTLAGCVTILMLQDTMYRTMSEDITSLAEDILSLCKKQD